jgi:prepilin-type processing-associated H-X9-DG protein
MLDQLSQQERLLLLRLLASFAWVDGHVAEAEKKFVRRLMGKLALSEDETKDVEGWLLVAPSEPAAVETIAPEHRRIVVESVRAMIFVDGKIEPEEQAQFDKLRALLG